MPITTAPSAQDERTTRISDQLVRLVQVFFALVLAQSLFLFRDVVRDPFAEEHRLAALALASVFYTTLSSWIDWHVTIAYNPYNTRLRAERWRVRSDVSVAVLYGYLLFTIEPFERTPTISIFKHLLGYVLVFAMYVVSGLLRRRTHGSQASRPGTLVRYLVAYSALATLYWIAKHYWAGSDQFVSYWLNAAALSAALCLILLFRARRQKRVDRERHKTEQLTIGVDVDGVLADQVTPVLPRVLKDHGVALRYEDITQWRLPIGSSDIAQEIAKAQAYRSYVLEMPLHHGASELMAVLSSEARVLVVTARKGEARGWTSQWLFRHGLAHDQLLWGEEAQKSEHGADILIDDYLGNLLEFLRNARGVAVLVDQPWNREREELASFIDQGRAFVVDDLPHLTRIWRDIRTAAIQAKTRT
jgi:uncharacterized HAD superfamily protein